MADIRSSQVVAQVETQRPPLIISSQVIAQVEYTEIEYDYTGSAPFSLIPNSETLPSCFFYDGSIPCSLVPASETSFAMNYVGDVSCSLIPGSDFTFVVTYIGDILCSLTPASDSEFISIYLYDGSVLCSLIPSSETVPPDLVYIGDVSVSLIPSSVVVPPTLTYAGDISFALVPASEILFVCLYTGNISLLFNLSSYYGFKSLITSDLSAVHSRNLSVWQPFMTLGYMGIVSPSCNVQPVLNNRTVLDGLGQSVINGNITIVDDKIRVQEEQRDALIKLSYDTITNEMTLADMDAATKRAVMVLQIAANDYRHLVELYVVKVLNLITDAKEYAFEMGKNAIDLARVKAEIAEEKGAIYIQKVDLQIQLEEIERKHVEIELMRAELAAAKAQTQLLMAEIDVRRAELRLIEVAVQTAMAEVEKIQIEVDIAMVLADIIVRGLAAVRYNVEVAEIAAGFEMIASRLAAILSVIEEKQTQLNIQADSKTTILDDIVSLNAANIEAQTKRIDEVNSDQAVQTYEAAKTGNVLSQEASQTARLTEEIISEIVAKVNATTQVEALQSWASLLIDAAMIVARDKFRKAVTNVHLGQDVHPNSSIVCS